MHSLKEFWTTSSLGLKLGIAALIIAIPVGVHFFHTYVEGGLVAEQQILKAKNQELSDQYNQALGVAKANEQAAREEKMKADALIATIEAGTKNVKALDTKLENAEKKYDQAKANLGECANSDDCLRRLHDELCAAGFKLADCPK